MVWGSGYSHGEYAGHDFGGYAIHTGFDISGKGRFIPNSELNKVVNKSVCKNKK